MHHPSSDLAAWSVRPNNLWEATPLSWVVFFPWAYSRRNGRRIQRGEDRGQWNVFACAQVIAYKCFSVYALSASLALPRAKSLCVRKKHFIRFISSAPLGRHISKCGEIFAVRISAFSCRSVASGPPERTKFSVTAQKADSTLACSTSTSVDESSGVLL